jgi:FtsP/CotA-like multicopper oxidase with cupredoxin domain
MNAFLKTTLSALVFATAASAQESIVPPPPRAPLPRPVANAPFAQVNNNRVPAGRLENGTLTLALDIIDAAWQPEGAHDPVVRAFAFAEPGKAPMIPGPLLRAPVGTMVRLTIRNRTDTAMFLGGLRQSLPNERDTVHVAPGATREVAFRLDRTGNFFYWAAIIGQENYPDRFWLDS